MAVYTEVTDEDLRGFLAEYDIGTLQSYSGIAEGVENTNFMVRTDRDTFILTLYEKRVTPTDLPFFLGLMQHLSAQGIECPVPIAGRDASVLRSLNGRPAAMVSFLQGVWPRRVHGHHCRELGMTLGRLHSAGKSFPMQRPNNLSVSDWRPLFESSADRADSVTPGLADLLDQELRLLESDWPDDLPIGIIHADLFPDNVFFLGEKASGVIDFYFACTDFLAYDLAICLTAWCFERDGAFNTTKARLLTGGYNKVRPLSSREVTCLPLLARGVAMRFLLTRLYDWLNHPEGAFVKPKDPLEYLRYLRFHQSVRSAGEYGVDFP